MPVSRERTVVHGLWRGLIVVCLLALVLGGRQITDEGYVSLQGDMPRHLMNGVFLADLLEDRPGSSADAVREYANLYYARYPALSLGHHPPLLPALEVPLFALFGPSIWAGRLVTLLSLIAATALLYLIVVPRLGTTAAFLGCALFVTSPAIVGLSQSVLSEMPAIALLLGAAYSLDRFWTNGRRAALITFVAAATLSLYAKQLAVFAFPAFLGLSLVAVGWRRLLRRDIILATVAIVLLALPLLIVTLELSPANINAVARSWASANRSAQAPLREALVYQLDTPVLILATAGLLTACLRRDRRSAVFVLWTAGVLVGLFVAGRFSPGRYSIYWVPALCALAASLAAWPNATVRRLAIVALVAAALLQTRSAAAVRLQGAEGYEQAAQFVVSSARAPTVLYGAEIDTGFFTFFVRKHDPARELIVLRAEKMLPATYSDASAADDADGQLEGLLRTFGTRFVVVEDHSWRPSPLFLRLRRQLQAGSFVERLRIPVGSRDPRLRDAALLVYEFTAATPPDPNAALSMAIPLVGRSLDLRLGDLLARKYFR